MADWVLIVDDDIANLRLAEQILTDRGMRVTALNSGRAMLNFVAEGNHPDLILLDILMPEMDGFETLQMLQKKERAEGLEEIPVVFLTADESKEYEARGFALGAVEFIRKPLEPEILIHRLGNILRNFKRIQNLSEEASRDKLTGLYNKISVNNLLEKACRELRGALIIADLDSFKLVNDLYGHETGDKILMAFSEILKHDFRTQDIVGRIGGDEFIIFVKDIQEQDAVRKTVKRLSVQFLAAAGRILGENMTIPLGVSAGAVMATGGKDYLELFNKADKALYFVKQNGKHDCSVYHEENRTVTFTENKKGELKRLNTILNERYVSNHALWLGQDAFGNIYRYMLRYIQRYHEKAYKILFSFFPVEKDVKEVDFSAVMGQLGETLKNTLRNSDIMMQSASNQFFLLLPMVADLDIDRVVERIMTEWRKTDNFGRLKVVCETEAVVPDGSAGMFKKEEYVPWVIVVDDDVTNLKVAGNMLSENNMRVTALNSGSALLEYLAKNPSPDLILMDILMPGMDGFETLQKLRSKERDGEEIPVIFLTGVEDEESEKAGLSLGAMDFIKKPLVEDILILRVSHAIELTRLQRSLTTEVGLKTSENEQLLLQVVQSLAGAIDAKDTYTNGHSRRVAEYAREIAKRYGYAQKEQDDIYMIGLLHDVGKIGVPDEVINKPSRLTDEEFALIKKHPVLGAGILEKIKNMPKLANGARWHHERYAGGGYPDGLSGEEIPEEARIIAVADAYDAMTSNRSYRNLLSQEMVRAEIEKGKGVQFDPRFAAIMLEMMDEDPGYTMRDPEA